MKNEKKNPYTTYGTGKIEAPYKKGKDEPRAEKTEGKGDLRVGGRK